MRPIDGDKLLLDMGMKFCKKCNNDDGEKCRECMYGECGDMVVDAPRLDEEEVFDGMRVAFLLDNSELIVPANRIEHRDGWAIAYWNSSMVAAIKDEFVKGFYLFME